MAVDPTQPRTYESMTTAARVEREAQQRIHKATKDVERAQEEANEQIERIRDQFEKQATIESEKHLDRMENTKAQGYEQLRNLKGQQDKDANRISEQGRSNLVKIKDQNDTDLFLKKQEGGKRLREVVRHFEDEAQYEENSAKERIRHIKENNEQETKITLADHKDRMGRIKKQSENEYQKAKDNYVAAKKDAKEKFEARHSEEVATQNDILADIFRFGNRRIEGIREDTARKLAAYSTQKSDPFYQIKLIDAEMKDAGDGFLIVAKIPIYERENISISANESEIVFSGSRRSEDRFEDENGKKVSTSSYQTFRETFPIDWPVDASKITRQFDGDYLIVNIPKKTAEQKTPHYKPSVPKKVALEKPKFPESVEAALEGKYSESQVRSEYARTRFNQEEKQKLREEDQAASREKPEIESKLTS